MRLGRVTSSTTQGMQVDYRVIALGALACVPNGSIVDDGLGPDTSEPSHLSAPLAALSEGDCPALKRSGEKQFLSGGYERRVQVVLPDEVVPGMPAMTIWHGLGDSGASLVNALDLASFASDYGVIVVVPESLDPDGNTWDIAGGGGADLVLYDDLRTCLSRKLEIDLDRFVTTGFSYGGFWSTFLTMERAETLATSIVMSGGITPFNPYRTPDYGLPVLIMWGGEEDTSGEGDQQVVFEGSSRNLSYRLRMDGHFVAECDHGLGHTVPVELHAILGTWLEGHVFGWPSPFVDGLYDMPAWCVIPR